MVNVLNLSKNSTFYYDCENKTFGRFPTKSNLKSHGSDNSLYFGMKSNEIVCKIFCQLFDVDDIAKISGKNFDMQCGAENVNVICNINKEGQIQIKLAKDGTMYRLTSNYAFDNMIDYDFTKMLIVIDLIKKEVRFKDPKELLL